MTTQVWLDLETTGLDEQTGAILEVGFAVVDRGINYLNFEAVVGGLGSDWTEMMPEEVVEMHMATGLFEEVNGEGSFTLGEIEDYAVKALTGFGDPGDFLLCGSGVSHFDRRWIEYQMPKLATMFRHGSIDVGIVRRWVHEIGRADLAYQGSPTMPHRALPDALDALAQYEHYSRLLDILPIIEPG